MGIGLRNKGLQREDDPQEHLQDEGTVQANPLQLQTSRKNSCTLRLPMEIIFSSPGEN